MNARQVEHAREYGVTTGTLGATSAQTLMVALLPVLLVEYAPSAVWIGLVIASEGFFSLLLPWVVGKISDRVPGGLARRFGRRNLFLMIAAPVMAVALSVAPFLGSYWALAGAAFVFFAALRVYVTPLWSLMVDSVPEKRWGRVEGVRGSLHSVGLGFGLVGGGVLYDVWQPLPFLIAAGLLLVTTVMTYIATPEDSLEKVSAEEAETKGREPGDGQEQRTADTAESDRGVTSPPGVEQGGEARRHAGADEGHGSIWHELRHDAPLRWFLGAHALWTAAVDGMRPYIFIFASVVIGVQISEASAILLILLVGLALGSFAMGWLSDRVSRTSLLMTSAIVMGTAMCAGVFIRGVPLAIVLLLPVGLGAAALVSLPYPLFASLVGNRPIGEYTGVFGWAVGLAQLFPPIIVGAVIDLSAGLFPEERGYPMMWPTVGIMALLGAACLFRMTRLRDAPDHVRSLALSSRDGG